MSSGPRNVATNNSSSRSTVTDHRLLGGKAAAATLGGHKMFFANSLSVQYVATLMISKRAVENDCV